MRIVPLAEEQEKLAQEIEALSEEAATEAYGALVSTVHQMRRMKSKLGKPVAIDAIEVFLKSFEDYVDGLNNLSSTELQLDYETLKRCIAADHIAPKIRHGIQAQLVVILGEMIRREGGGAEIGMSGYRRAQRMLERMDQSSQLPRREG
jgi:hypothetical protein